MLIRFNHPEITLQSLGMIPHWLLAATSDESFIAIVEREYISGWNEHGGGTLNTATGAYQYPGDPVQMPLATIYRHGVGEVIFMYQHAFFAVIKVPPSIAEDVPTDLEWHMARLD